MMQALTPLYRCANTLKPTTPQWVPDAEVCCRACGTCEGELARAVCCMDESCSKSIPMVLGNRDYCQSWIIEDHQEAFTRASGQFATLFRKTSDELQDFLTFVGTPTAQIDFRALAQRVIPRRIEILASCPKASRDESVSIVELCFSDPTWCTTRSFVCWRELVKQADSSLWKLHFLGRP